MRGRKGRGERKRPLQVVSCKGLKFVARPARFELTTFGSGGQRSIQLSYERTRELLNSLSPGCCQVSVVVFRDGLL